MPKHCDDYIDDPAQPEALRVFLARARAPAHGHMTDDPYPELYADLGGKPVRVVMASRMGDVGITWDLTKARGYSQRVYVETLTNFRNTPA